MLFVFVIGCSLAIVSSAHADVKPVLTITANDATIVWGDAIPALTLSYDGFLDGDNSDSLDMLIVATTEATVESNAGTYAIVPDEPTPPGDFEPASVLTDTVYDLNIVNGTLTILKADQTITEFEPFLSTPITSKTEGDADFTVSALADSGLAVSFAGSGACSVLGSTVHIESSGTCTITATQAGDTNWNAADAVVETFEVIAAASVEEVVATTHRRGGGGGSRVRTSGGRVLGESTYYFSKDLYIWDEGQDVLELQKILIADNRKLDIDAPSGFFGRKTQAALRLYQSEHGVNPTGNAGPLTRAVLNAKQTGGSPDVEQQIALLNQLLLALQAKLAK